MSSLKNELIIHVYRLHTKSLFLVGYFVYLSGRRFQTDKVTVQCLPYKQMTSYNLLISSAFFVIFKGLSVAKNCLKPENAPLSVLQLRQNAG